MTACLLLRLLPALIAGMLPLAVAAECPTAGLTPIGQLKDADSGIPDGRNIRVRGIVTGDFRGGERLRGFYLQTGAGADSLPSGIFVFTPNSQPGTGPIAPGVEVIVSAETGRFRGLRQLTEVEEIRVCGRPGLPAPVALPFPARSSPGLDRFEGLYVTTTEPLTVSGNFELRRYGSLSLAGERLFQPTNSAQTMTGDGSRQRLILDDGSYRAFPAPVPWLDSRGTRRVGSLVTEARGILTRAFDGWRLHPLDADAVRFRNANPRPDAPGEPPAIRIAGFNVENYFLTIGQRGAATDGELARQQQRLTAVAAGLEADMLGLVEVENRPEAVADLARRLGDVAGIDGGYRHFGIGEAVGADSIRVMLAWDPDQVTLLSGPFVDDDPVHRRPPVAGLFRFQGDGVETLVAVIHHKSKSGCPDHGDIDRGQGCWNRLRSAQSRALAEFLSGLQRKTGSERVLILGDINSYGNEEPVQVLRDAGFIDLIATRLPPESRYSYVYHDESGYLDAALANPLFVEAVSRASIWHINADEPPALHDIAAQQTTGPWRSSDHDPVVIDLHPGDHGGRR